jgi:hypothetical protein
VCWLQAPSRKCELIAMFNTEYIVSGLAPFGNDLVTLAYVEEEEEDNTEGGKAGAKGGKQPQPERPELHIVSYRNANIASDALTVRGYERCRANDYHLEFLPEENYFYVISPHDIVVAKPCDLDDHITWLQQRGRFEEACLAAEGHESRLRVHDILVGRPAVFLYLYVCLFVFFGSFLSFFFSWFLLNTIYPAHPAKVSGGLG